MYAVLPILLVLIAVVFWYSWFRCKKTITKPEMIDKAISTIVVLLFMFHPDISEMMFNSFNCMKVDDDYRLVDDIVNVCYKGEHLKYMGFLTLPGVILWAFGIPAFAFYLLLREKKSVDRIMKIPKLERTDEDKEVLYKIKVKYGFLFSGYRIERLYWEVVLMYRKLFIIMVCVFLSVVSSET